MVFAAAAGTLFAGGQGEADPAQMEVPEGPEALEAYAAENLDVEKVRALKESGEQQPLALTADEAVDYAVEHNLNLASTRIDEEIKRRQAAYAWNRFIPTMQVSGMMSRANKESSMSGLSPAAEEEIPPGVTTLVPVEEPESGTTYGGVLYFEETLPRWSVAGNLELSLQLNYAMFQAIRGTQIDLRAGKISTRQAEEKLERDVRKSFYNLLLMQRNIELMEEQIDAAERRYEQARINYENGMVPELTMLSARVSWENLKPQLQDIKLGYRQALQGFKMNLGLDLQREITLEGSIEAPAIDVEAEKLINDYLTERLDIRSLMTTIESLESQLSATKLRAFTPNVILGFSMDPALQGDPWDWEETNWLETDNWSQQRGGLSLTVAMSLDAFLPWSTTQVGLRELEDNIKKTRIGLLQAIRGAEMEIRSTVRSLEKARDSIDTLQLNVERARRAYQMAEEAYNAGSKELLEVQNAEIELKKARLEVLRERYNYIEALLDLEYALNTEIEDIEGVDAESMNTAGGSSEGSTDGSGDSTDDPSETEEDEND
jgi:outer membrane protein TolC